MIATSTKPVRECRGCALNLVKQCAVFQYPVMQWKHRQCEGYNNSEMIARYQRLQHPDGAHGRKKQRAERAKLAHTTTHRDGVRPLRGSR